MISRTHIRFNDSSYDRRLRRTVLCSSSPPQQGAQASVQASIAASKAREAAKAAAEAAGITATALNETGSSIPVESQPVASPPEQAQETSSSSLAETIGTLASSDKDQILDALLPTLLNTPLLPSAPPQQEARISSPLQSNKVDHKGSNSRDEEEGEGKPKFPELTQELIDESPVVAAAVIQAEAAAYSADVAAASQARGAEAQRVAASSMIRGLALAAFILSDGLKRSVAAFVAASHVGVEKMICVFAGKEVGSDMGSDGQEGGPGENQIVKVLRTFALRLALMVAVAACVMIVRRWVLSMSAVKSTDPMVRASLGQGIINAASTLILELQKVLI